MTADMVQDAPVSSPTTDDVEEFIRSVAGDLLGYFARRVSPAEDSADCLSETLLVLWRRRGRLPAEHDQRRAWSFGIARNVLNAHRRTAAKRLAIAERLRTELRQHPIAPESSDDRAITALASLPRRDQELVCLVAWEGLGVAEAGAVLGLRADAARARYSRARRRLRDQLLDPSRQ
ncbi:RNA polymerase sigma factor [Agromyces sp. ZXT2-3]|uniref:RNA polymerase sigma factor n=1 Tax=Agromyces sp. ZXT2-3 TaxID=3461152 RepID=UPI004054F6FB